MLSKFYNAMPNPLKGLPPDQRRFLLTVAAIVLSIVGSGVGVHLFLRTLAAKDASVRSPSHLSVRQSGDATKSSDFGSTSATATGHSPAPTTAPSTTINSAAELPAKADTNALSPDNGPPMESAPLPENPTASPTTVAPVGEAVGSVGGPLADHNHLAYPETDPTRLVPAGLFVRENYEREEHLDYEAAQAFNDMKSAAAAEGISLMLVSGYRSVADQTELFAKQTEKHGSPAAAARLSAPPGHSEHHTGYAIDITDANRPDTDLTYTFASTPAYQWLVANAARYGFEESFPDNNVQGVSYEPWHWRYINSDRAKATFSVSKVLYP